MSKTVTVEWQGLSLSLPAVPPGAFFLILGELETGNPSAIVSAIKSLIGEDGYKEVLQVFVEKQLPAEEIDQLFSTLASAYGGEMGKSEPSRSSTKSGAARSKRTSKGSTD